MSIGCIKWYQIKKCLPENTLGNVDEVVTSAMSKCPANLHAQSTRVSRGAGTMPHASE